MAYIPFIYFSLLILYFWLRYQKWGVGLTVLSYVDISAFFSILIDINDMYGEYGCNTYSLTVGRVLLYCLLWTIIVLPLLKIDSKDLDFVIRKPYVYIIFCWVVVVCVLVHLYSTDFLQKIYAQFQMSGSDAYAMRQELKKTVYTSTRTFWLWIPMIVANSWPLILLCWFVNQILFPEKRILNLLILFCAFVPVLSGLSTGSRGAFVWWISTFLIYMSFFSSYIPRKVVKWVRFFFLIILLITVPLFVGITSSRFGSDAGNYVWYSIIGYAGQMLNNFSMCLEQYDIYQFFPDRVFPLYNLLFNHVVYVNVDYYDIISSVYNMQVNVFVTVFGALLLDVGVVGLCVFMIIYLWMCRLVIPRKNVMDFSSCILFAVIICVPVRGLFDYPFAVHVNTLYIFFSFFLYLYFRFDFKK